MTLDQYKQLTLPDVPGIYTFSDEKGTPLYIGRATSLKDRTKSYFMDDLIQTRGLLLIDMVSKAHTLTWQETRTVLESIILEAQLIKKHQPYFNTKEKDNKSFYYVIFTAEAFPRVLLVRETDLLLPEYAHTDSYGPYPSGPVIREALRILRRILPFRSSEAKVLHHAEFYRQIGLAPDTRDSEAKDRYKTIITRLKRILSGQMPALIKDLETEMQTYAKAWLFEKADEIKWTRNSLIHLKEISLIKDEASSNTIRIEGYDVAHQSGTSIVGVMTVIRDGVAFPKGYKKFKVKTKDNADDPGSLAEILTRRLAHTAWQYPEIIVVDGNKVQRDRAMSVLQNFGLTIPVIAVTKDEKHQPKVLLGDETLIKTHQKAILLANQEAHRSAVLYLRARRKTIS